MYLLKKYLHTDSSIFPSTISEDRRMGCKPAIVWAHYTSRVGCISIPMHYSKIALTTSLICRTISSNSEASTFLGYEGNSVMDLIRMDDGAWQISHIDTAANVLDLYNKIQANLTQLQADAGVTVPPPVITPPVTVPPVTTPPPAK